MSESVEGLRREFEDPDVRYGYVQGALNAFVAAQIKELREARGMSQQALADAIGTKQSGISRLQNANYSSWKVDTLRKLARAFHVRLRISFEEFGTLIPEIDTIGKRLRPRPFESDPVFGTQVATTATGISETVEVVPTTRADATGATPTVSDDPRLGASESKLFLLSRKDVAREVKPSTLDEQNATGAPLAQQEINAAAAS